nr:hypothetical protein [Tanacetum cinerariifolium]
MLVEQKVAEEGDADENDETVNVQPTPPQSPQVQPPSPQPRPQPRPQPQPDAGFPMNLFQEVMDTCATLTRRVEHLEFDKVAQALEITKLKGGLRSWKRGIREAADEAKEAADQAKEVVEDAQDDVKESAQDQGRQAESHAEIYKIDMDHANKVLSMQEDKTKPSEVQEVVDVVTTAKLITKVVTAASETITAASVNITADEAQVPTVTLIATPEKVTVGPSRRRKGVVIRDPEKESTTSTIIPAETKSKDKGKGILVEEPKPLKKKKKQIEQDEQYSRELQAKLNKNIDWDKAINHVKRKAKEDPAVKRYQMDYFKGMSYDDIHPIFEAKFNSNVAFLLKTKEQIEEDENRAPKRLNETPAERAAKRQKLDEEIIKLNNKPYYKIIRPDDIHQLYPKNFSGDFLLVTLRAMFKEPDIYAQIWKTKRNVHGSAKVKGWKLLESCGVQIITFTSTQLILLVDRKYPLTRFTLDQMLNAVRLKVVEESEVSLELLRFTRQQHQEGQPE